jgi:hypothetical protein
MNVSREDLQYLANQPLGSAHLQQEAERVAGRGTPSGELVELCKRVSKRWLPQGKSPPRARHCNVEAEQIDIEDAIEAAGGQRGKAGIA